MAAEPTEPQKTSMAKPDEDVRTIMVNHKVPYDIISRFADLEFTSLGDFVEYFVEKENVKQDGPGDLGFADGENGYNAQTSRRAVVRLAQAWETAKAFNDTRRKAMTANDSEQIKLIMNKATRKNMEALWEQSHNGAKPPLDKQVSDTLMGLLMKELSTESVPVLEEKRLVCKIDENLGRVVKERPGPNGTTRQVEEEEGIPATELEGFKSKVDVHITSYLMLCKTPQHIPNEILSEKRLIKFKNFFFGEHVAGAMLDLPTVKQAYFRGWREMVKHMHENDTSISCAMDAVQNDVLMWQSLIRLKETKTTARQLPPPWTSPPSQPFRTTPYDIGAEKLGGYKGKPPTSKGSKGWGGYGKGAKVPAYSTKAGKGSGKPRGIPQERCTNATRTPPTAMHSGGQPICFDHHLRGDCRGGCYKSHDMCPRLLAAGRFCFDSSHPGYLCPGPH